MTPAMSVRIRLVAPGKELSRPVSSAGERLPYKQEAVGSTPTPGK